MVCWRSTAACAAWDCFTGIRAVACCCCPPDDSSCSCTAPNLLPASACRGLSPDVEPLPHCDTNVTSASGPNRAYRLETVTCGNLLPWSGVDVDAAGDKTRMSGTVFPTPAIHAARGTYNETSHGVFYVGCDGSGGISLLNDHLGFALRVPRFPEIVDFAWHLLDGVETCALWKGADGHIDKFRALYEGTNLDPYLYYFSQHATFSLGDEAAAPR